MKNIKIVLLLELLVLVVGFFAFFLICGCNPMRELTYYIDLPSLLGILIFTVPFIIVSGQGRNFIKAFSVGKKEYSLMELKDIVMAIGSVQKVVVYAGLIDTVISIVLLLQNLTDSQMIGPNLAVALLTCLYIVVIELFLLPLKVNAVHTMNKNMDFDDEV
jgi:hypothetical protein